LARIEERLEELLSRERSARPGSGPLSKARAARQLTISRTRTLNPLIEAGLVRTVPKGSRVAVPQEEVERLQREGVPAVPTRRRGRSRRAAPSGTVTPGSATAFARELVKKRE
jgi:hypothetical protein